MFSLTNLSIFKSVAPPKKITLSGLTSRNVSENTEVSFTCETNAGVFPEVNITWTDDCMSSRRGESVYDSYALQNIKFAFD